MKVETAILLFVQFTSHLKIISDQCPSPATILQDRRTSMEQVDSVQ